MQAHLSAHVVLGPLRLRGVLLVYVGEQSGTSVDETLGQVFGSDLAWEVRRHLFELNRAPMTDSVRETARRAFNGGMSRW